MAEPPILMIAQETTLEELIGNQRVAFKPIIRISPTAGRIEIITRDCSVIQTQDNLFKASADGTIVGGTFEADLSGGYILHIEDTPEREALKEELRQLRAKIEQAEPYTLDDPDGSGRRQITEWENAALSIELKLKA